MLGAMSTLAITFDDIRAAADRLHGVAHRTPVLRSNSIDEMLGAQLFFKCENLQRTGSFKIRGATYRLSRLTPEERARGVVAASGEWQDAPAINWYWQSRDDQLHQVTADTAQVFLDGVRVPVANLLRDSGSGFEIAQARLGPGRIHHCMRTIGTAEVALQKMVQRLQSRVAFGKRVSEQSVWEERIANARIDIEMTRLLCLKAADMMDKVGNKVAQLEIAMIKVAAPRMALRIIDDAIQAHGGAGVTTDPGLAKLYAGIRTLRLADGPDEVHNRAIARMEFGRYRG